MLTAESAYILMVQDPLICTALYILCHPFSNPLCCSPASLELCAFRARIELKMLAVNCMYWSCVEPETMDTIGCGKHERDYGIHGGHFETALMRHLAPVREGVIMGVKCAALVVAVEMK
jgi:hypothetical protein